MNNNNEGRTADYLVRCKATDIDDCDLNEHEKGVIVHQATEPISPRHGMEEIQFAVDLFQGSLIIYASMRMPHEDRESVPPGARAVHRIVAAATGRNPTVNEPQITQAGGNDPWTDTNNNEQKIPVLVSWCGLTRSLLMSTLFRELIATARQKGSLAGC